MPEVLSWHRSTVLKKLDNLEKIKKKKETKTKKQGRWVRNKTNVGVWLVHAPAALGSAVGSFKLVLPSLGSKCGSLPCAVPIQAGNRKELSRKSSSLR